MLILTLFLSNELIRERSNARDTFAPIRDIHGSTYTARFNTCSLLEFAPSTLFKAPRATMPCRVRFYTLDFTSRYRGKVRDLRFSRSFVVSSRHVPSRPVSMHGRDERGAQSSDASFGNSWRVGMRTRGAIESFFLAPVSRKTRMTRVVSPRACIVAISKRSRNPPSSPREKNLISILPIPSIAISSLCAFIILRIIIFALSLRVIVLFILSLPYSFVL